jgi:RNA methyltransferase, TrmH family
MTNAIDVISSRENALAKEIKRLAQDGAVYRKTGRVWLEGEHLCDALSQKGQRADVLVVSESFSSHAAEKYKEFAIKLVVFKDSLLRECSVLESAAPFGMLMSLPARQGIDTLAKTVVLDRLQDPGNVGSILRSAAAFGYSQVLALKGTVALWSPKVLRAGMGAHLSLRLLEGVSPSDVKALSSPLAVTSSHRGQYLHELQRQNYLLSNKEQAIQSNPRQVDSLAAFSWVLGHEGQGVSTELERLATQHVRIAQPGGEESLNVAVAAAIVLHASCAAAL